MHMRLRVKRERNPVAAKAIKICIKCQYQFVALSMNRTKIGAFFHMI